MIRAICLLVFLCTIGLARAQAQSGVITLTVVDAETGEAVSYTHLRAHET